MANINRRWAIGSFVMTAAAAAAGKLPRPIQAASSGLDWASMRWARGIEGQRKADLGNGKFLNPVVSGDHPDPSVLKHGRDYYAVFSTFDAYPGLLIWHSRDLVNWQPLEAALKTPVGSVYAPDLSYHDGLFYIYFPTSTAEGKKNWVITAKDIRGPWSEPVDLNLPGYIDPNHVVGEDGKRYLALSTGDLVPLTDDGLALAGAPIHIYDPWHYPDDWVVEAFAPEGPKIFRHNDYFYMLTAVGGTAGPPTGHMVIVARSRSLKGPWVNALNNPIVHTKSAREKWWSRGHASAVVAPDGSWWLIYHGYENGYWTLGRQTLLSPMHWTADGWIAADGGDLSTPLRKPGGGEAVTPGMALSDDFSADRFGSLWSFYLPARDESKRVRYADGAMIVAGKGTGPADCSPICFKSGDLRYEVEVEVSLSGGAEAGLLLFYNRRLYCGLGFTADHFVMHRYGLPRLLPKPAGIKDHLFLRITNDCNIVAIRYSLDGRQWTKFDVQMEVSGYNHNTGYDFLSLRPALYAAASGDAQFRNCCYRAW